MTSAEALRGVPRLVAFGLTCVAGLMLLAHLGDYPGDAGPAVDALAAGSFRGAAAVPFLMGPLSIVLRAPFAWGAHWAGGDAIGMYRAGVLPCLAAAGLLGVALAQRARIESGLRSLPLAIPILAILSPASLAAVQNGHPEEALGGALSVAAVLLAIGRRPGWAGIALGLAIATKQWALVAMVPALLAASPGTRVRLGLVAALTAAVFYVPFIAENPHAFLTATSTEAHVVSAATPETVWLIASHAQRVRVEGFPVLTYHPTPRWVPPVSHSLIVLIGIPLGLILRKRGVGGAESLALLALLFLLRCALDPVDQDYFHLPFVLSLLAWEVATGRLRRGLPVATLAAASCLWVTFGVLQPHRVNPWLIEAVYLAWTSAIAIYLLRALGLVMGRWPRRRTVCRSPSGSVSGRLGELPTE